MFSLLFLYNRFVWIHFLCSMNWELDPCSPYGHINYQGRLTGKSTAPHHLFCHKSREPHPNGSLQNHLPHGQLSIYLPVSNILIQCFPGFQAHKKDQRVCWNPHSLASVWFRVEAGRLHSSGPAAGPPLPLKCHTLISTASVGRLVGRSVSLWVCFPRYGSFSSLLTAFVFPYKHQLFQRPS